MADSANENMKINSPLADIADFANGGKIINNMLAIMACFANGNKKFEWEKPYYTMQP